ncbi:hypothetical protein PROFUN_14286 [Planoprotostelium fungivorum]|uniref:Uncharacterized protein n=1 Tax=Planoprotostelium fungivorum TaxID=1890364 RepID=A0A2P6N0G1_9EUKA|nr:hypothetical protein PROFUN_14286 [Planoprotostelium fungivorum]
MSVQKKSAWEPTWPEKEYEDMNLDEKMGWKLDRVNEKIERFKDLLDTQLSKIDPYVPLFFDIINNSFRLKWWTVLTIFLIWAFVGDRILSPIQFIVVSTGSSFTLGQNSSLPTHAKVTTITGNLAINRKWNVTLARIQYFDSNDEIQSIRCDRGPTVAIEPLYRVTCGATLHSVAPSGVTDDFGMIAVPSIQISDGIPGIYSFLVNVDSVSQSMQGPVLSDVGSISLSPILTDGATSPSNSQWSISSTTRLSFQVAVYDYSNHPLSNKTVYVLSDNGLPDSPEYTYQPDEYKARHAVLQNYLAVTGSDGVAVFSGISVSSSSSRWVYLKLYCEGITLPFPNLPMFYDSTTGQVNVVNTRDATQRVTEGEIFPIMPVTVYAFVVDRLFSSNLQVTDPLSARYDNDKGLEDAISLPTDNDGLATFENLRFNTAGSADTIYNIYFLCNGVRSTTISLNVSSVVDSIVVLWDTSQPFLAGTKLSDPPTIIVYNHNGYTGVPGKKIFLWSDDVKTQVTYDADLSDETGTIFFGNFSLLSYTSSTTTTLTFTVDSAVVKMTVNVIQSVPLLSHLMIDSVIMNHWEQTITLNCNDSHVIQPLIVTTAENNLTGQNFQAIFDGVALGNLFVRSAPEYLVTLGLTEDYSVWTASADLSLSGYTRVSELRLYTLDGTPISRSFKIRTINPISSVTYVQLSAEKFRVTPLDLAGTPIPTTASPNGEVMELDGKSMKDLLWPLTVAYTTIRPQAPVSDGISNTFVMPLAVNTNTKVAISMGGIYCPPLYIQQRDDDAATLEIVSGRLNDPIMLGQLLANDTISVALKNSSGSPLVGRFLTARIMSKEGSNSTAIVGNLYDDIYITMVLTSEDKRKTLLSTFSSETDTNGIANFPKLSVLMAQRGTYHVEFVYSRYYQDDNPITVATSEFYIGQTVKLNVDLTSTKVSMYTPLEAVKVSALAVDESGGSVTLEHPIYSMDMVPTDSQYNPTWGIVSVPKMHTTTSPTGAQLWGVPPPSIGLSDYITLSLALATRNIVGNQIHADAVPDLTDYLTRLLNGSTKIDQYLVSALASQSSPFTFVGSYQSSPTDDKKGNLSDYASLIRSKNVTQQVTALRSISNAVGEGLIDVVQYLSEVTPKTCRFFISALGGTSEELNAVSIPFVPTNEAKTISVVQSPPLQIRVGSSFSTSVLLLAEDGSPVPSVAVTVSIQGQKNTVSSIIRSQSLANASVSDLISSIKNKRDITPVATLDPLQTTAMTNKKGIAQFNLVVKTGLEGSYTFLYQTSTKSKVSFRSDPVSLSNNVASITIVRQPAVASGDYVTISADVDHDVNSLVQPVLLVRDNHGNPIADKFVVITSNPAGLRASYNHSVRTNSTGHYTFNDLRFLSGGNNNFSLTFQVDGLSSNTSNSFIVINKEQPDLSQLSQFSNNVRVYLAMALCIPFLLVNASLIEIFWEVLIGIFCCLGVTGYLLWLAYQSLSDVQFSGSYVFISLKAIYAAAIVIGILPLLYVIYLLIRNVDKKFYDNQQKNLSSGHVTWLLRYRRPLPLPPNRGLIQRMKVAVLGQRTIWNDLQRDEYFAFSTRILVAWGLSLLMTLYAILITINLTQAASAALVRSGIAFRQLLISLVYLPNEDIPIASLRVYLNTSLFNSGNPLLTMISLSISQGSIIILYTGYAAIFVAVLFTIVNWYLLKMNTINMTYRVRQGRQSYDGVSITTASGYIGAQAMHTFIGFFFVWFTIWIVLSVIVMFAKYCTVDFWLLFLLGQILAVVLSVAFLAKLLRLIFATLTIRGPYQIAHKHIFSLLEFINVFVSFLTALIQAIVRFFIMIVTTLLFFQRVDSPMLPNQLQFLDRGYRSWISAVAVDAMLNNPIVITFVQVTQQCVPPKPTNQWNRRWKSVLPWGTARRDEMEALELFEMTDEALATNLQRKRAITHWKLAYLLLKNPTLIQYRKRHMEEKATREYNEAMQRWERTSTDCYYTVHNFDHKA